MEDHYLKKELYEKVGSDPSFFDFVQSASLDGLWYWDLEQPENEWMSPEFWWTLGYDPAEREHKIAEWQEIIFQEDLTKAQEALEAHLADPRSPYDQIVRYRHASGGVVWVRCRGMAVRDPATGKPYRMLGAHTDVTSIIETDGQATAMQMQVEALQMQVRNRNLQLALRNREIENLKKALARCQQKQPL